MTTFSMVESAASRICFRAGGAAATAQGAEPDLREQSAVFTRAAPPDGIALVPGSLSSTGPIS